ncbi:hypothetical protein F7U66_01945 [Vibrio parahaemolyticus]|nr:hypothetical protein [Vibrio parahaemolyticus]
MFELELMVERGYPVLVFMGYVLYLGWVAVACFLIYAGIHVIGIRLAASRSKFVSFMMACGGLLIMLLNLSITEAGMRRFDFTLISATHPFVFLSFIGFWMFIYGFLVFRSVGDSSVDRGTRYLFYLMALMFSCVLCWLHFYHLMETLEPTLISSSSILEFFGSIVLSIIVVVIYFIITLIGSVQAFEDVEAEHKGDRITGKVAN